MQKIDHISVVAPTLLEGVEHLRECLNLDIPFGTHHTYMGTHNHRLQLGGRVYLETIAVDPNGAKPNRARWFGLDDQQKVRSDWEDGRRLHAWVASTTTIDTMLSGRAEIFGEEISLPPEKPEFGFSLQNDGTLPLDGAVPTWIDHRTDPTEMDDIPDMGAVLKSFSMTHPNPTEMQALYQELRIKGAPEITAGSNVRYRAEIETPSGLRILT